MAIFEREILDDRRRRAADSLGTETPLVLIGAGEPIGKPGGLDQTYPFVPHPEYYWLTGSRRPGGVVVYDADDGWTDFVRPITEEERLWEGEPEVAEGKDVDTLPDWLKTHKDRPIAMLGSPVKGVEVDKEVTRHARKRLDVARRPKDPAELELVERAVVATARGFAKIRDEIRPGVTERHLQIELEAEMFRHGADDTSFGTIVGAGTHAAVLHFEPGDRVVGDDDLVLIDAGGSILGYAADVSRTYPASGEFTPEQRAIFDIVLASQHSAITSCRAGVEWYEVHRTAAAVMAAGLRDLGILKGEVEGLLESEAIGLFFPHGIGHMVGLGIRDVSGRAPDRKEARKYCGARLRVDLPLEAGFLMTIEPGLYFVPAILDSRERRERFRDMVAWDRLDQYRSVGGVRIEDDILITDKEPRNLTQAIPK